MEPVERVVPHFRDELERCKARLLEMGGLAEEEVRLSVQGLVDRDGALIDRVMRCSRCTSRWRLISARSSPP